VEAIAAVLALKRGLAHETVNVFRQDPEIKFKLITGGPMERQVKHVLSNGFGFGGQNSSLVLSRFNG
jgi:3-oxoacyl-[acyl-carrier-protein] synthase II